MKALKSLVVFMGVLIVLGIGVLGYGLYMKSQKLSGGDAEAAATAPAPNAPVAAPVGGAGQVAGSWAPGGASGVAPVKAFDILSLGEPKGTVARKFEISGTTLVVELAGGGGPPRLAVVDLAQGTVLGTILINDGP